MDVIISCIQAAIIHEAVLTTATKCMLLVHAKPTCTFELFMRPMFGLPLLLGAARVEVLMCAWPD